MSLQFTHTGLPSRVVFGAGALARLGDEIDRLRAHRALVLSTPQQADLAERVLAMLGTRGAGVHAEAVMHVPVATAVRARARAAELGADCAVAIGGGSTIGLGKAIALTSGLPILAIPTTYAGSEMTPIYGLTEGGIKKTGRNPLVLPRTVIYDPELSASLPLGLSVTSGLNAIAHAAEGLYAEDRNPVTDLMAEEGIRAMAAGLRRLGRARLDAGARADCLYGAWLCGSVLGSVGMALHHKLCHTLGGSFDLPHAETHSVVLPHALAYNAAAAPEAMRRIARALATTDSADGSATDADAPAAVQALARALGAPVALRDIGLAEADIDRAADIAASNAYWNPRPLDRHALRALLQRAWAGAPPGARSPDRMPIAD